MYRGVLLNGWSLGALFRRPAETSVGKTRRGRRGRVDIGRGPDPISLGPGPILPLDNVLLILEGTSPSAKGVPND